MKRDKFVHLKKKQTVVVFTVAFLVSPGFASAGWWEKGSAILKDVTAPASSTQQASALTRQELVQAFKEALHIGAGNVVEQLGASDGFNADPQIHIPLPEQFQTVKTVLGKVGMAGTIDDLELRMNRAAEAATPKAKELFWQAISEMTFADAKGIYEGPENAATLYFKEKMSPGLKEEMRPLVENAMAETGTVQVYDLVMGKYQSMPFVPDIKTNLTEHVLDGGLKGIFYYLAQEEAAIRKDPARQTTAILKRVFGR